ncbi:MAG: CpaF family protein [Actinobacteria bacterium]|nr:CpaF family protein [Actinomycetota bacterium]
MRREMGGRREQSEALVARLHHQLIGDSVEQRDLSNIEELTRSLDPLLPDSEVAEVVGQLTARVSGLGVLEPFLADPSVSEVMVNGGGAVWIERDGHLVCTELLIDESMLLTIIERIVGPLGLSVDRASPIVDARLPDGSRVNAVVRPVAVDGPCLTIRRFGARQIDLSTIASPGTVALLRWAVRSRMNLIVCGGAGAGKTTLLNALAAEIGAEERVITVEDAAELRLPGSHVVRLEARPAGSEGVGAHRIRDLVRNALRMRPDRIVVGEVRSGEAIDMLQAMNTGHEGSLSTCHANGPADAMRRLETLVLMGDVALPLGAIREQLRSAIDLVVCIARQPDGSRRVVSVAEVCESSTVDGGIGVSVLTDASGALCTLPSRRPRGPFAAVASPAWIESSPSR